MYHIITWDLRQNVIQMFTCTYFLISKWNYLLVMSMCGTGQMTCRKPANIFRSTILDAKWCTTSLLEITCTYFLISKDWSCPCVGLVRWLVASLKISLEVLFWMLSVPHHYLRFETECHTDVHVHICSCQNENYLLVMSMCGTGQMTCSKPANIFRSTILDAKWCTTSLLEIWDRMSYRCTCTYLFLSKWKLFIGHVHVWDWSDDL